MLNTDLEETLQSTDLVEDEDTSSGMEHVRPWDPAKIRITTKNFSLREIVEQIDTKEVDLAPDFQREFVWKRRQRTRLIESLLLGIPLPAFYFNQEEDGRYQVVDGVQRLSTVYLFMSNQHVLGEADLEYLANLDGCRYQDLDQVVVRRFRSTQIVVHIIEPQTPDEVKYDIFGRVNTLGSPLSTQEIRHAMSRDRSRTFLRGLSELENFDLATGYNFWRRDSSAPNSRVRDTGRMMSRELALRFCAFRHFDLDEYRQYPSLDAYLVEYTKRIDGRSDFSASFTDGDLDRLSMEFDDAMLIATDILGENAFRRWLPNGKKRSPINRAIFESQAVAFASFARDQLLAKKSEISRALQNLFNEEEYTKAVTVGTGAYFRIDYRLRRTREAIQEALK